MLTAVYPVVFFLAGLILYVLFSDATPRAKVARIGEILFAVGAFWLCNVLLGRPFHLG